MAETSGLMFGIAAPGVLPPSGGSHSVNLSTTINPRNTSLGQVEANDSEWTEWASPHSISLICTCTALGQNATGAINGAVLTRPKRSSRAQR